MSNAIHRSFGSENSDSTSYLQPQKKEKITKIVIGILFALEIALIFSLIPIHSLRISIVWKIYASIGIGVGVLLTVAMGLIFVFLKVFLMDSKKTPFILHKNPFLERPVSYLDMSSEEIQEQSFPNEILMHIFSYLGYSPRDLMNTSLVCRQWYQLINLPNSITQRRLNDLFAHGFPLHQQMSKKFCRAFSSEFLAKIPTISYVFEKEHLDLSSITMPVFLDYFKKENASVLKGQEPCGDWFFMIRAQWFLGGIANVFRASKYEREGQVVILVFREKSGERKWVIKSSSYPSAYPQITPKSLSLDTQFEYLQMEYTVLDWLQMLLSGEVCGALNEEGGSLHEIPDILSITLFRKD